MKLAILFSSAVIALTSSNTAQAAPLPHYYGGYGMGYPYYGGGYGGFYGDGMSDML
jgi:hypothetical protein